MAIKVNSCIVVSNDRELQSIANYNSNSENFFAGICAGVCNTTGCYNIFLGQYAGQLAVTGTCNILIGKQAGRSLTGGNNNFFVGTQAGFSASTACKNTILGCGAGFNLSTGSDNIVIGDCAGKNLFGARKNIFLGRCSGCGTITGGDDNIFLGSESGKCNYTGCSNIFFSNQAGFYNSTGKHNIYMGFCAGWIGTTGSYNTFIGYRAGQCNIYGSNNLVFGCNSGVGTYGLCNITTESNHIIMGNCNHTNALIQVAWTAVSDCRDKHIYCRLDKGRGFLNDINPIVFSFKNRETNEITDTKKRYGFSAQEILQLEGDDPVLVGADNPEKLGLTTDYLIPILVNAIKEMSTEIDILKNEIIELKSKI
jgi:hypothetical protein